MVKTSNSKVNPAALLDTGDAGAADEEGLNRLQKPKRRFRKTNKDGSTSCDFNLDAVFDWIVLHKEGLQNAFKALVVLTLGLVISFAIFGVPTGDKVRTYLKEHTASQSRAANSICRNSSVFTDLSQDDGSSPCDGLCYAKDQNILVPCAKSYSDGCNTCTYNGNGGVSCTRRGCAGCYHMGWHYAVGETVPTPFAAGDSCNTCKCQEISNWLSGNTRYQVQCTQKTCHTCLHRGEVYKSGKSFDDLCIANAVNSTSDDDATSAAAYGSEATNNYYDANAAVDDAVDDEDEDDDDTDDNIVVATLDQNMEYDQCTCQSNATVTCNTDEYVEDVQQMDVDDPDYAEQQEQQQEPTSYIYYGYDPYNYKHNQYAYQQYLAAQEGYDNGVDDAYNDGFFVTNEFCEGQCVWEGQAYEYNQCFKSKDGVNQCACLSNGKVACSACPNY